MMRLKTWFQKRFFSQKNDAFENMVPKKVFFTKGIGKHKHELQSFELALRNAGIEKCNLVKVSSIVPPKCKIITREKGIELLNPGEITYCVMSRNKTNEPNRLIGASVGVAVPRERRTYGYISEHHSYGEKAQKVGDHAEDLAATMLATTMGLDFDPDKAWDERKQEYKMSGRFVRTQNVAQTARGDKDGLWTTVIAAAVFIED
jgi:arginine decarboxylase